GGPGCRRAGRCHPALAAPPRAGLSLLRRHPAPGQALWRRTGRCRLRPRAGAWHPVLHLGCRHPEEPSRARPQRRHRAAAADPREYSRTRLLPLTRGTTMLIHPTVERLRARGLTAMADAFIELQNAPDAGELSREDWLGLLVDREATSRENKRLARRLLLVTSQVPVNRWHEVIGDPTLADAILDRIIHRAHRIDLKGPSLRRRLIASESPAA